jgi:hypothetical protein
MSSVAAKVKPKLSLVKKILRQTNKNLGFNPKSLSKHVAVNIAPSNDTLTLVAERKYIQLVFVLSRCYTISEGLQLGCSSPCFVKLYRIFVQFKP